jgi:hypothetical protein
MANGSCDSNEIHESASQWQKHNLAMVSMDGAMWIDLSAKQLENAYSSRMESRLPASKAI